MNTDPGNLYPLRPGDGPAVPIPEGELLDVAHSLRSAQREADSQFVHYVLMIAANALTHPLLERDFQAVGANCVVTSTPMEALEQVVHRGQNCLAVLTEADLYRAGDGYVVSKALRACGFMGPVWLLTGCEPLARDRADAKRQGISEVLKHRSAQLFERLAELVQTHEAMARAQAAVSPTRNMSTGTPVLASTRYHYPAWLEPVIKNLAKHVGPSAGDVVRKRCKHLHARFSVQPTVIDLVEEVAEVLNDSPSEKARFIKACLTIKGGA